MKLAKVGDFQRRLRTCAHEWPVRMVRFAFDGIPGAGTGEIPLPSPIVVLAGPNGVGKTTLLRALWAASAPASALLGASAGLKLRTGSARFEFCNSSGSFSSDVNFSGIDIKGTINPDIDVIHLDAAVDARVLQNEFCRFESSEDIVNGIGVRNLKPNEENEINYISRREYRDIKVYETDASGEAAPFFEVSLGNDRYDTRTMGAGELAILYLWWTINRAPKNALLLIEEPETYLSPASQVAISHFILQESVKKYLNVVITSHSAKIIESFSEGNLVFLFRDGSGVKVVEGSAPPTVWESIGISPNIDAVALVEDNASKELLKRILEKYRPVLARQIEICVRNGEGNITTALRSIAGAFSAIKIVGMFDGDMRERVRPDIAQFSGFLPGNESIEKIFRSLVQSAPDKVTAALGTSNIAAILSGLQGTDSHDWYTKFCIEVGLTREQLFPILFRIWHDNDDNANMAKQSVEELAYLLHASEQY